MPELRDTSPQIREAFHRMDLVDVEVIFRKRAVVIKSIPPFLPGPFRTAMRTTPAEAIASEHVRRARGWTLFLLLPRMLLGRQPRGGPVSKEKLPQRFQLFSEGRWAELIGDSERIAEAASSAMHRKRRRRTQMMKRRAARALSLVQLGELSAALVQETFFAVGLPARGKPISEHLQSRPRVVQGSGQIRQELEVRTEKSRRRSFWDDGGTPPPVVGQSKRCPFALLAWRTVGPGHGALKPQCRLSGWDGRDRLWPIQFGPIRFWPSCFAGQFGPKLVFCVLAMFGQ